MDIFEEREFLHPLPHWKLGSCLLKHCDKLNCIYDKVLVVDNISVAKELVRMLTTQYRHLVHACDTEARLVYQIVDFMFLPCMYMDSYRETSSVQYLNFVHL